MEALIFESCYHYHFCEKSAPMVQAGKWVGGVEYKAEFQDMRFCPTYARGPDGGRIQEACKLEFVAHCMRCGKIKLRAAGGGEENLRACPALKKIKAGHARGWCRQRSGRVMESASSAIGVGVATMEIIAVDLRGLAQRPGWVAEARMPIHIRTLSLRNIAPGCRDPVVKSLACHCSWGWGCVIRRRLMVSAAAEWKQKQRQTCDRK